MREKIREYTSPRVAFVRLSFLISPRSVGSRPGTSTRLERVFLIVNGSYAHSRPPERVSIELVASCSIEWKQKDRRFKNPKNVCSMFGSDETTLGLINSVLQFVLVWRYRGSPFFSFQTCQQTFDRQTFAQGFVKNIFPFFIKRI